MTSLRIAVLAVLLATSAAAQDVSSVLGRWKEDPAQASRKGHDPIGMVDVVPCYGSLCVMRVKDDGGCEARAIMVVSVQQNDAFKTFQVGERPHSGTFKWDGENGTGFIRPFKGNLVLVGYRGEEAGPVFARALPAYSATLKREGTATCAPPPA